MASIRVKTSVEGGVGTIRMLITHPMETGQRKDDAGNLIPAHYIQEVICEHKGRVVLNADWGPAVSRDPYLSFDVQGAKAGDPIKITWRDTRGGTDVLETRIENT